MTELFEIVRVVLLALLPMLAGCGITAWLLPNERRLPIIVGGGLAIGHALSIFVLITLLRVLSIDTVVTLVFVIAVPPAIYAIVALRNHAYLWDIHLGWSILALSILGLISVGTVVDLGASVWTGSTHENLAVRMAMAAHAAESSWPVMDPYSPDHQRLYRHAAQVWTAALMRASGAGLYPATVITVLASICAIAGGLFAALSQFRSYISGLFGSVLFLTAGPANFLGIWKAPFDSLSTSIAYGLATVKRDIAEGYVLGHGLILAPGNDYTVIVGLSAASGAVFLTSTLGNSANRRRVGVLLAAMTLATAGAVAEQIFPVAAATLFATAIGLAIRGNWRLAITFTSLVGIASLLIVIPDGTYSALFFGSEVGQRSNFALTPEHFLRLPTEYLFFAGSKSLFFAAPPETFRVWIFEPIGLKELGWIYLAIVTIVILSVSRGLTSILPFAVAPVIALLIPGIVSDQLYEINIAKFTVLAIPLGGLAAGVAAAELLDRNRSRLRTIGTKGLATILIVFACATWVLGVPLWPAKLSAQPYPHVAEDLEAATYLRSLEYGRRAVVLPGPKNKEEVNSNDWEGMHRFVISFGATSIPMGLDHWGASHLYQPRYLPAYHSLDETAMEQLKINILYVAPHLLSEHQQALLTTVINTGRAQLIFESAYQHRQIYAYQHR